MRPANIKDRCTKKRLNKSESVVKLYDELQLAYASILEANEEIKEIRCNVPIDSVDGSDFTSDFVCVKTNGDIMVRECVYLCIPKKPEMIIAKSARQVITNNQNPVFSINFLMVITSTIIIIVTICR